MDCIQCVLYIGLIRVVLAHPGSALQHPTRWLQPGLQPVMFASGRRSDSGGTLKSHHGGSLKDLKAKCVCSALASCFNMNYITIKTPLPRCTPPPLTDCFFQPVFIIFVNTIRYILVCEFSRAQEMKKLSPLSQIFLLCLPLTLVFPYSLVQSVHLFVTFFLHSLSLF